MNNHMRKAYPQMSLTMSPSQILHSRREHIWTYDAILKLRRAGYRVWRGRTQGLHTVDGRSYTASQLIEMAEAL